MGYGGGGYGGGGYGRGGNGGGYGGGGGRRPFEKKDGEGRLFEEGNKKGPNSPDFSGYIIVNGQEIKISGWGKSGQRGFSINLKVKQGNQMMPEQGGQSYGGGYGPGPQQGFQPQPGGHGIEGGPFPPRGQQQPPYGAPANARPFPGPQQPPQGGWAPPQGQAQPPRHAVPYNGPSATHPAQQGPSLNPAPSAGVGYGQPPGQDFSPPPEPDDGKLPF